MVAGGEDLVLGLARADRRVAAVAGPDGGLVGEGVEAGGDRLDLLLEQLVRAGVAGAAGEERVAHEGVRAVNEGNARGRVAGNRDNVEAESAHLHRVAVGDGLVELALGDPGLERIADEAAAVALLEHDDAGGVVAVRVRQQDGGGLDAGELDGVDALLDLVGGVDESRLAGGLVDHDVDVVAESGGAGPHDAEIAIDQLLHGVLPGVEVGAKGTGRRRSAGPGNRVSSLKGVGNPCLNRPVDVLQQFVAASSLSDTAGKIPHFGHPAGVSVVGLAPDDFNVVRLVRVSPKRHCAHLKHLS